MHILPVIDVLRGQVVRGIAGRRETYQPIVSLLATDAQPGSLARAFVARGATSCYVADLDAISGAAPSWPIYRDLIDGGLRLWVDAGCRDESQANQLAAFEHEGQSLERIIVGLESLEAEVSLQLIHAAIGRERLVFSLDLKHGAPLTRPGVWPGMSAWEIARQALAVGVRGVIVLDLAAVGSYDGPATLELCTRLRLAFPQLEITSGGGVRGVADVQSLVNAGCDHVLVASALHDGRIAITAE